MSLGSIGLTNMHNPRIPGLVAKNLQHLPEMHGLSVSGFFNGTESKSIITGMGMPSSGSIIDLSGFTNTEKAVEYVLDEVKRLTLLA